MPIAERLSPDVFRLPVEKIRSGYYSDSYFVLTKELLEAEASHPRVTVQVFAKRQGLLGGIDEALAILGSARGGGGGRELEGRLAGAEGQGAVGGRPRSSPGRRC